MKYKLLAADMDGTALTDDKRLTERTVKAINRAKAEGKLFVFCTGRSIGLIKPYLELVDTDYAITCSGGTVIELKTGKRITDSTIDAETVKYIFAAAQGHNVFPVIYIGEESYGTRWNIDNASDFGLNAFVPVYKSCMTILDDAIGFFMQNPQPTQKLNLIFSDSEECTEVFEQIKELPVTFTAITPTSLEINASGVDKVNGLRALCAYLGIDISETIAVGDAMNDEKVLAAAGLAAAVDNATDKIKSLCDVIYDSNENDGVAKLIEDYLLD